MLRLVFNYFVILGPLGARSVPQVVAVVGQDAYINCPIYGYPVKKITWKLGNGV